MMKIFLANNSKINIAEGGVNGWVWKFLDNFFCFKNIYFHNLVVQTRQETFSQECFEWQFSKLANTFKKFVSEW